jgi:membrane protease YdiL (CAAX protease family)
VAEPNQTATALDEAVPPRWGLGDVLLGLAVAVLGSGLTSALALAASDTPADQADQLPLAWLAVAQLGLWFGLLGAPWLAARYKGNGMRADFGLDARWTDVPVGVLCGLIAQFAIVGIIYLPIQLLTDVTAKDISEPAQNLTDRAAGPLGVVLLVMIVGIGAPIVEEIFYRGLAQRSLIRRFGPVWGIALASVLFAATHLELLQFPALVAAGAVFGVLAYRFDRLGPAIFAHMVFNMTAVVALLS